MIRVLAALALSLLPAATLASQAQQQPLSKDHDPANLTRLMEAHDYLALGKIVSSPETKADLYSGLGWLRERMIEGNSAFIAMLYARNLWMLSAELPQEQRDQLREMAVLATLYASAAIVVDGTRCGDVTAPGNRATQLATLIPEIPTFLDKMPLERRKMVVEGALLTEQRTAARRDARGDVAFLCMGGMEEIQYNLRHGTAKEAPQKPGQIGRNIQVFGDGHYRPSVTEEKIWKPRAEAARVGLRARLERLAKIAG
ncbi:MAG: hypothetical protein ACREB5_07035 [Sphingomonadaceae bacterium]